MSEDDRIDAQLRQWGEQQRRAAQRSDDGAEPMTPYPRRRVGLLAVAAAAAVLLIAGGALALRDSTGTPSGKETASAPSASATTTQSTSSTPPAAAPETRQVTYHGLGVDVPANWVINDATCGIPQGDTLLLPGPTLSCLVQRPPGITWVQMTSAGPFYQDPSNGQLEHRRVRRIEVDGHPATRTTGAIRGGDSVVFVSVPAAHAGAIVYSPSQARANAIADTLKVVAMDTHGCASRAQYRALPANPPPAQAAARRSLIPGHPESMTVCGYVGAGLFNGVEVPPAQFAADLAMLRSLPHGYSIDPKVGPRSDTCTTFTDQAVALDPGDPIWYTVLVQYPASPTLVLHARVGICGYLGITNGAFAAQRGPGLELIDFLNLTGTGADFRRHVVPAPH
jgi:hypothetical protein